MFVRQCASLLVSAAALAQAPKAPKAADALGPWIHERVVSALKSLDDGGDLKKAQAEFAGLFALAAAYEPASDGSALAEPDSWMRLTGQLAAATKESQRPLLTFLLAHESLAREVAMTVSPLDSAARVYEVLSALITKDGPHVADHPALAAAVCVVFDVPHYSAASRRLEKREQIDPVDVFEYFIANEGRMLLGLKDLPPQVLIYLVDTEATVPELQWALKDHAGDRNVGKRYGDLTYDTASFKFDQPKKISALPYTLQNLRQVGGVCEEQAYYAAHVAKAIGVPATMIEGRSSTDGHAWVGFLQLRGGGLAWNMNEGHYNEYEKLRGTLRDPQTGLGISDDELALTADLCSVTSAKRHQAIALADAASLLLADRKNPWRPAAPTGVSVGKPRAADSSGALELLSAAHALAPSFPAVWTAVQAAAPRMDTKARAAWFDTLATTCGRKYPTFAYGVLAAMIRGISDPQEQSRMWDWAFKEYRTRADLAEDARLHQGRLWESAGDKARAYEAYLDVSRNFSNDGTAVVQALAAAERLLQKSGKDAAIADMYADAFRRIARPSNMSPAFFASSNYYQVGERYARALDRLHRENDAANVRRLIERGVAKPKSGG